MIRVALMGKGPPVGRDATLGTLYWDLEAKAQYVKQGKKTDISEEGWYLQFVKGQIQAGQK